MRLWLLIARRYFFSRQKRNFINILSIISLLGVAVGTAALVIVLSAFNGMRDVAREMYQVFDPTLKVMPASGKWLQVSPTLLSQVRSVSAVEEVSEALEDNVLLMHGGDQAIARLKAVSASNNLNTRLKPAMIAGQSNLNDHERSFALVGVGIVQSLKIDPQSGLDDIQLWYPKNKKSQSLNPENAFNKRYITVGGTFGIEASFDNQYVMAPIAFGVDLMAAGDKRSYLEVALQPNANVAETKEQLQDLLGNKFIVQDGDDQHADLIKILRLEKLFVFIALSFILLIASFNIYVSLSMLAVDKQADLTILRAMGADDALMRRIFMAVGSFIAISGALIGLGIGIAVCIAQQTYGFVGMGITNALVDAYPVTIDPNDLIAIGLVIVVITLLSSLGPALKAMRIGTRVEA